MNKFIDNGVEVFGAALTALGTGGRAALVSTPNGMDKLYYKTYEQSKSGDNDFHIIEMKWYQDKRYNYDLVWTHEDDDTNSNNSEFDFDKLYEQKADDNEIDQIKQSFRQGNVNGFQAKQ